MNLFEYQAKQLLGRYGVQAGMGQVAASPTEALQAARRLGCSRFVVKAQAFALDRMSNDGVAFASSPEQVAEQATRMMSAGLKNDTAPGGNVAVGQVYIEEFVDASRELYAAVTVDRASGQVMLLASAQGGVHLEKRAAADPTLIVREPMRFQDGRLTADFAGLAAKIIEDDGVRSAFASLMRDLAAALIAFDATLIELNPLAVMHDGRLIALDAKMTIDDNALYRRPELAALRHENERLSSDQTELEAQRFQINYLSLDGDIGLVCNGAGLALATIDMVQDAGGRAANFMDIRTTAKSLDIAHGFGLLINNPKVSAILVNVHGGGMQRCDTIAEGIGIALRRQETNKPIVIRMAGNNADFARTVLANNGVDYIGASDTGEAVAAVTSHAKRRAA